MPFPDGRGRVAGAGRVIVEDIILRPACRYAPKGRSPEYSSSVVPRPGKRHVRWLHFPAIRPHAASKAMRYHTDEQIPLSARHPELTSESHSRSTRSAHGWHQMRQK